MHLLQVRGRWSGWVEFSGKALESHSWIPGCAVRTREVMPLAWVLLESGIIAVAGFHVRDVNDSNC